MGTERNAPALLQASRPGLLDTESLSLGQPPLSKPVGAPAARPRRRRSLRYVEQRLLLFPAQLIFVLFVFYVALELPAAFAKGSSTTFLGFLQTFGQFLANEFTGNWGVDTAPGVFGVYQVPLVQVYAYVLPTSLQLAIFGLPLAIALAYPVSLLAGWSRRTVLDTPAQMLTLTGALLPVFVIGLLLLGALFASYLHWFQDVPGQGLMPSQTWFFFHGGNPSWTIYTYVTRPTGFPLIDALLHHAWTIALISLTKTLIQAVVVAIAYLAIFFRHARSVVRSVRDEQYIVGARARGVSERTLLWRYAARRVTPSFLLILALTLPEYLGVQFAVETAFADQNAIGYQTFLFLTTAVVGPLESLVFVVAIFVLGWILVTDVIVDRLIPPGLANR